MNPSWLERLEAVPWAELVLQGYPRLRAGNVPVVLKALAEHGPNFAVAFDTNLIGYSRSEQRVPRSVATEMQDLVRVAAPTPRMVPFLIELIGSDVELPARRLCVRWLQSFFKHCSVGQLTGTFDIDGAERSAKWVEELRLPEPMLQGQDLDPAHPAVVHAFDLLRVELDHDMSLGWELERKLGRLWERDTWRAIVAGLDTVLGALDAGDEALGAEVVALASWLPRQIAVIAPRLEALAHSEDRRLLGTMALVALARLGHPVANAIQVMGDSLESRGERGLPAIYLAAADVLASKGNAGPKSRRALLKVDPQVARLPDPFSTTVADLVKRMSEQLVWPKKV